VSGDQDTRAALTIGASTLAGDATLLPDGSVASDQGSGSSDTTEPAVGDVVGRYVILARLGSGGMGVVFKAYDPQLDRAVALKLLRAGATSSKREAARTARLLREAQAMARLSHPGVVAVFDAGTVEPDAPERGRSRAPTMFIAMEYIEGCTLERWLAAQPRPWRRVLDVLIGVGEGVAAAHEAGIVHRDLKPDNVMVGPGQRVRVMDFGLARAAAAPESLAGDDRDGADSQASSAVLREVVTQVGALVGTPAYMAPEQWSGGDVGPATDQFAFCVTAWEALVGERPFASDSTAEQVANVLHNRIREPTRPTDCPAWVRQVLARGLAVRPDERWPSMDALLAALRDDPSRGHWRRRGAYGMAALLVTGIGGAVGLHRQREQACLAAASAVDEHWNETVAARADERIAAKGSAYAESTWRLTRPVLDEYAEAWREARAEACRSATIEGEIDDESHARMTTCLDEELEGLIVLVGELTLDDPGVLNHAIRVGLNARSPDECLDEQRLRTRMFLPEGDPQLRADVEQARRRLRRVNSMLLLGKYAEALEQARAELEHAEALAYDPLIASGLQMVGILEDRTGQFEQAHDHMVDAYVHAVANGQDVLAGDVADQLAYTTIAGLARPDEGMLWARLTEASARRQGRDASRGVANAASKLGMAYRAKGDLVSAAREHRRALELWEGIVGPDHPQYASNLSNLSTTLLELGQLQEARAGLERAYEIRRAALPPGHPDIAVMAANLGAVLFYQREHERALELFEQAVTTFELSLGPDHPNVGTALSSVAAAQLELGRHEAAQATLVRSLEIMEARFGTDHVEYAAVLQRLADIHLARGAPQDAVPLVQRAVAIERATHGSSSPHLAPGLTKLGRVLREAGDSEAAIAAAREAVAVASEATSPQAVIDAHFELAQSLAAAGRPDEARIEAQAALAAISPSLSDAAEIEASIRSWMNERER
jgi:eukaryotic-like serine/threonine-protein kinase